MRLQDYRDAFYTFTEKASDLNRQLAFAAIAIIWLFKKDVGGQPSIPVQLILPGILIVSSLVFDMLHYCVASIIWRGFYRSKENAGFRENAELSAPVWAERPIWLLFGAKISCAMAAYIIIGVFLFEILIGKRAA